MNCEIILAFVRHICLTASCARYREGMYQLHELLFLYNYAWIEIDESLSQHLPLTGVRMKAA